MKLTLITLVAQGIAFEFLDPPSPATSGRCAVLAARVAVPEASVDEEHSFVFWKYNVWAAREFLNMKAEAIPHLME